MPQCLKRSSGAIECEASSAHAALVFHLMPYHRIKVLGRLEQTKAQTQALSQMMHLM